MDEYTMEEFESLYGEYCSLEEYTVPSDGVLKMECVNGHPEDMRTFFERIGTYNKERPLKIKLDNTEWPLTDAFAPVSSQIISLTLKNYTDLKTANLKSLTLPNLIELEFHECRDISVKSGDFDHYPQLRLLSFTITNTFASIESGAFEYLENLMTLSLESEFEELRDADTVTDKGEVFLEWPEIPLDRAPFLRQLHCSPEFKWLRDLYDQKPHLLQARQRGEIYKYGSSSSPGRKIENIFIPVDCAKWGTKEFIQPGKVTYSFNCP